MPDHNPIPFHRACLGKEEFEAVYDVLVSGWLTTGEKALKFEREFASYVGTKHAVAVNSCTAALQLALDAIHIKSGDEVLVPTYTFAATAEVCTYFGAVPVLCDSELGGMNIDPADAVARITDRTKAIIAVHIAGQPCNLDALAALAQEHDLCLIEDAAHALPAEYHGKRVGGISPFTAFSFYATKTITTGEGGMLTTADDNLAARARMMRLHGISGDAWKRYSSEGSWYYEVQEAGYKLNMPDILAGIGLAQLRKADDFRAQRQRIASSYLDAFSGMPELQNPPIITEAGSSHSWHLFILRITPGALSINRAEFIQLLRNKGIGTSVHFIPLHLHPYYQKTYGYSKGSFRNAEDAYSRCLSLPIFPGMTNDDVEYVIETVRNIVTANRTRVRIQAA